MTSYSFGFRQTNPRELVNSLLTMQRQTDRFFKEKAKHSSWIMIKNLPDFGGRAQKGKPNGGLDRRRYVDLRALTHKSSPVNLSGAPYFRQAKQSG